MPDNQQYACGGGPVYAIKPNTDIEEENAGAAGFRAFWGYADLSIYQVIGTLNDETETIFREFVVCSLFLASSVSLW